MASVCSAQERKDEWKDPAFDLKTIKTVVIVLAVDKQLSLDEFSNLRVQELVTTRFTQSNIPGVRFMTYDQFESAAAAYSELDLKQLRIDDPKKYSDTVQEWLPIVSDGVLTVNLRQYGYSQVFVPESTYTYTDYEKSTVTEEVRDKRGHLIKTITKEIKVPVEKTCVPRPIMTQRPTPGLSSCFRAPNSSGRYGCIWI